MDRRVNLPLSLLKIDVAGGVATITINRPDALNSLNPAVLHQLQQAFDHAVADANVQGIVIAGEGKAFVVGADISFFLRNLELGDLERIVKFTELGHRVLNAIDGSPKPVVARVHGHALGGGFELALACDYVVATPAASFGFPETGLGIYPGLGGTQRTPRAIGVGLAKWLIFTGKTLSAQEAWKLGIVDACVTREQLNDACHRFALKQGTSGVREAQSTDLCALDQFFASNRVDDLYAGTADTGGNSALMRAMKSLAGKSLGALRLAERLIEDGGRRTIEDGLQMEIDNIAGIFRTEDAYRGLAACAKRSMGGDPKPTV